MWAGNVGKFPTAICVQASHLLGLPMATGGKAGNLIDNALS
jgi:hypothetical protein